MPITPMPPTPQRSQPLEFADKGDAWLAAFPLWGTEATALENNVNAKEATVVSSTAIAVGSATVASAAANFKGLWSGLTGALNVPASVYHNGNFWTLASNLADVTTATPGVSASWIRVASQLVNYAYEDRGTLRTLANCQQGDYSLVSGLGLFMFELGSVEPDDDESCFAATGGRWLLEAISWDVVDAWSMPDSIDERLPATFLSGTVYSSLTSLGATTQTTLVATITGAEVGDSVVVTPADALSARISIYGRVSAADTVTVYVNNPSAGSATLVVGTWKLLVIKDM